MTFNCLKRAPYPLAEALHKAWAGLPFQRKGLRTDIVSPELCGMFVIFPINVKITLIFLMRSDDALQRLSPSLARHTGCTIIDINPGAGLWSSKIHEHLRPKRHLLLESEELYLPFLKPLLDAPGSRYLLRDWSGWLPWTTEPYLSEGLIPELPSATMSEGRNESLLIIANVGDLLRSRLRGPPTSHVRLFHYLNNIKFKQNFQAHGTVRLLLWMQDSEKRAILPRTVSHRRKLSLEAEMSCHIEEIVGGPASQISQRREDILDINSSRQVAEAMAKQNIRIPFERKDEAQKLVDGNLLSTNGDQKALIENTLKIASTHRSWHTDLEQMREDFRDGKFSEYEDQITPATDAKMKVGKREKSKIRASRTPEYLKLRELQRVFDGQIRTNEQVNSFLRQDELIKCLESNTKNQILDEVQRQRKEKELRRLIEDLKRSLEKVPKIVREAFWYVSDNRRAFNQNPPLLMWDCRTAEPLIAREDEFYNPTSLALLDFQPKVSDPFPMSSTESSIFQILAGALFSNGCNTIFYLNSLAPGATEAIAAKVPALRDSSRGGRQDLWELRARCFTPDMFYGITKAWETWPFKLPLTELMSTLPARADEEVIYNRK